MPADPAGYWKRSLAYSRAAGRSRITIGPEPAVGTGELADL